MKGAFAEQEKSADQVAERGLRRESDRDREHAGRAEQHAELDAELLQRSRQAEAEDSKPSTGFGWSKSFGGTGSAPPSCDEPVCSSH